MLLRAPHIQCAIDTMPLTGGARPNTAQFMLSLRMSQTGTEVKACHIMDKVVYSSAQDLLMPNSRLN
eukprot:scaffold420417_cov23-Prasinocladus_malaysianus.AAC.1